MGVGERKLCLGLGEGDSFMFSLSFLFLDINLFSGFCNYHTVIVFVF